MAPPHLRNSSDMRNRWRSNIPGGRKHLGIIYMCLTWGTPEMDHWTLCESPVLWSWTPHVTPTWKSTLNLPDQWEWAWYTEVPLPNLAGSCHAFLSCHDCWTTETVPCGENFPDTWGWNPVWFWVSFPRSSKNLAYSKGDILVTQPPSLCTITPANPCGGIPELRGPLPCPAC